MAPVVIENLQRLGVDHLLTIGGDDTLSYSSVLSSEHSFPVVAVPKTMDNDVQQYRVLHWLLDGTHSSRRRREPAPDNRRLT